jgi:DNA-binding transcriptional regulator YdaS (Cro superfamily)
VLTLWHVRFSLTTPARSTGFPDGNFPDLFQQRRFITIFAMGAPNAGKELIARLVRKLGSAEAAAARLGIRPTLVERFAEGLVKVPDSVLLKALDLMTEPLETPALRPASKPPKGRPVI